MVSWQIRLQSCIWNIRLLVLDWRNPCGSWFEEPEALGRWRSILGGSQGTPAGRPACEASPWEWFIIAMHFILIKQQATIIFSCRHIVMMNVSWRIYCLLGALKESVTFFLGYCCSSSVGFEFLPIYGRVWMDLLGCVQMQTFKASIYLINQLKAT